jgi:hypothetical protein
VRFFVVLSAFRVLRGVKLVIERKKNEAEVEETREEALYPRGMKQMSKHREKREKERKTNTHH